MVKYCNRECQIAHRPQHKKECRKRAAELHDEELFKQPPPDEDCPICMMRLPTLGLGKTYLACCGKSICNGCVHAFRRRITKRKDDVCPFCRIPMPTSDEETIKRYEKRIEMNDAQAIHNMGVYYSKGLYGFPQDYDKALELYNKAVQLGCSTAHNNIGNAYHRGSGVEINMKKAQHHYELAAMGGVAQARHNLGIIEGLTGNRDRALRHLMIAISSGYDESLKKVKFMYEKGYATKDYYKKALESYQAYLDEIKSEQRDKAAAANDSFKYIG